MLNMLTKTRAWLAVAILATTATFADQCKKNCVIIPERGHEMAESQVMPAYGAPALLDVRNSWDFYGTGSFIYWQARQENMEIGLISENDPEGKLSSGDSPFTTSYVNNIDITSPNFTFRPGFKLGVGVRLNWDGWDAFAEFTRFHSKISSGVRPLSPSTVGAGASHPNGQYLYPIQGAPGGSGGVTVESSYFYQSANQSWKLKMDFVDLSIARAYYSGTKLTVRPFFGVRGAWIRQNLKTSYAGSAAYLTPQTETRGTFNSKITNFYSSWGVGPRTGFESNWMIGRGLRFIGNGSGDILYTRYDIHENQQTSSLTVTPGTNPIATNASISQDIDYLRTHLDLELGFGWGMYFHQNDYHIDLSATYGFQVFWNQNMFRSFQDQFIPGASFAPNGDLFIHGLTATARFDF